MTSQPPRLHDSQDQGDQMVTAERSMFGTRLPRPTGVGRHLVIVLVVFAVALGLAIVFAESGASDSPQGAPAAAP
ncbi:MAG: hypothetical protein IT382_01925 [Deltaproteobacteria bacterium]|nr:hypothetical protein [Deltaproteobacteria bacterium]